MTQRIIQYINDRLIDAYLEQVTTLGTKDLVLYGSLVKGDLVITERARFIEEYTRFLNGKEAQSQVLQLIQQSAADTFGKVTPEWPGLAFWFIMSFPEGDPEIAAVQGVLQDKPTTPNSLLN